MKQLFFLVVLSGLIASCGKKAQAPPIHGTQIIMVYNVMQHFDAQRMSNQLLSLFNFNIDQERQADFSIVLLHGTLLNASQSIRMDGFCDRSEATLEQIENHSQMVTSFCNSVNTAIVDFPRQYGTGTYPARIETWATLAQELELLAASRASQRALIFYGSLAESEPGFCSSSYEGSQLLEAAPEKVIQMLEKRRRLPGNLVRVSIYFIFPVMNEMQTRENMKLLAIYQQLLRERGARVIVQPANKSIYE